MRTWHLAVPGELATLTGGYGYARRMVAEVARLGWRARTHRLSAAFPHPDSAALEEAARVLHGLPANEPLVVDGLALGAMPELAATLARVRPVIGLVHHPLAEETGLSAAERDLMRRRECAALESAGRVVATSRSTADALVRDYGVASARLHVVEPGTDRASLARGSGGAEAHLLCVATLTPRKGHAVLLEALGRVRDRPWRLVCAGSERRDPDTARSVRARARALGLADRVEWTGELSPDALAARYAMADLFVLASFHEGYGMALAEALAHGLPIVATAAGAIPATVPPEAGLLVPPGDAAALAGALARVLDAPDLRGRLAAGARRARERLPSWAQAGQRFAAVLALAASP